MPRSGAVIVIQYLYIFTFNWHPDLRLPLSSALAGITSAWRH
jgi:hypothetical protein